MRNGRFAVGVRAHSGWAAVTVVGGTIAEPHILARRRLTIAPSQDDEYVQPYHVAASLGPQRGRTIVERCAARAQELAEAGLRDVLNDCAPAKLVSCAILTSRAREPLDLERTLRSHALIHAAEGLLFREAVARAAFTCGMDIQPFAESDVVEIAARAWGAKPEGIQRRLTTLGRQLGSPWTRDEKLATVAALLALA